MKFKGFTLAEVLITLTVIGVLAAILTPVLQKAVPDPNKALFRKAYNTVVTAVSDLINDEESYPSNILGNATNPTMNNVSVGFNNLNIAGTLVPASVTTTDGATVYSPNKFCYLFSQEINTVGNEVCPTLYSNGTFSTRNGMSWTIVNPAIAHQFPLNGNDYSTRVVVDVNGSSSSGGKGPDCSYLPLSYNGTTWQSCSSVSSKVWPDSTDGITPDIYDIGVRYDGSVTLYKMKTDNSGLDTTNVDKAANEILSTPAKNAK